MSIKVVHAMVLSYASHAGQLTANNPTAVTTCLLSGLVKVCRMLCPMLGSATVRPLPMVLGGMVVVWMDLDQ
jgi:uncharacterized protein (DUF2236 family)